ncbi:MAG: cytochrome P450 [Stellaceae bacterium]
MTVETAPLGPRLAAPEPPDRYLGFFKLVRTVRDSSIASYPEECYRLDFIDRSYLWAHAYIVNAPDGIRHVLLDRADNYVKTRIGQRLLQPALGQGLLTSEGETWRRHRRIMAPAFDPRSVASYAPVMIAASEAQLGEWDALPDGSEIALDAAMMRTTLQIIAKAMFSSDSADVLDLVSTGVGRYQREVRPTLFDLLPLPRWLNWLQNHDSADRIFSAFDAKIEGMIAARRTAGGAARRDLLARLLDAEDEETGKGLNAKEVRDEIVTIFMAGHETTSLALTWTWYLLSQHPAEEAKLHAELDRVLGGRTPQAEDIPNLPYARMVIDEAIRLYPPAHTLAREAVKADEILGHHIPAGAVIYLVPWLIHRNQTLWNDPDRFDPERFSKEKSADRPRYAYLPFGAGPRICIGAAFAMTEAVLILATLAQRYRLHLKPGHPVEPQGLITLRPRHGIAMILERRH